MPTSPSSKKSLRQSEARQRRNYGQRKAYKTAIKTALVSGTQESVSAAYKAIDKATKRGILKPKATARKKSRLVKAINRSKSG